MAGFGVNVGELDFVVEDGGAFDAVVERLDEVVAGFLAARELPLEVGCLGFVLVAVPEPLVGGGCVEGAGGGGSVGGEGEGLKGWEKGGRRRRRRGGCERRSWGREERVSLVVLFGGGQTESQLLTAPEQPPRRHTEAHGGDGQGMDCGWAGRSRETCGRGCSCTRALKKFGRHIP